MDDLEPSLDGLDHLNPSRAIEFLDGVVAGNNEQGVMQWNCPTLCLTSASIVISPDLQEVTKAPIVMVVHQDSLLAGIAIKPL